MKEPAAIEKAESLYRYAQSQGCHPSEFEVAVTASEADELLEWLPESGMVDAEFMGTLLDDIAQARRAHDPFIVLKHFSIAGLAITPSESLH